MEDEEAKDLICKLLIKDPNSRYGNLKHGAEDIKRHPWYVTRCEDFFDFADRFFSSC